MIYCFCGRWSVPRSRGGDAMSTYEELALTLAFLQLLAACLALLK